MTYPSSANPSIFETGTLVVPLVVMGTIGFAIGVTVLVGSLSPIPDVLFSCLEAAKWMAVSALALVVMKWVRDFYYACKEVRENGFAEGAKRFAIEAAVTIAVPIVGIAFGFVGPLFR